MTLIRWTPGREVSTLQSRMNRLFDDFFGMDQPLTAWEPLVDIREDEDAYYVHAELPGVEKDDVKITLHDNMLTIRGEKAEKAEKKMTGFHRSERMFGTFERTFTLPSLVRTDKIDANYSEGVLTVTLPKTEEAKPKEIQVKVK